MDVTQRLVEGLIRERPDEAAAVLERLGPGEAAAGLRPLAPELAARALGRMESAAAGAVLAALPEDEAAELVKELPVRVAAHMLRRTSGEALGRLAERLPERRARQLRSVLRHPEGTAGALLDPNVLALPEDLSVVDALARVRSDPEAARYNVYVVDRDQRLVGALNLRELMLGDPKQPVAALMHRDPYRLRAETGRREILEHPGWREVHALPVVDGDGSYLGAVRYHTLRALEHELTGVRHVGATTADALGDLFAAGASGLVEALLGAPSRREGGDTNG